jgi:hypothetical protein
LNASFSGVTFLSAPESAGELRKVAEAGMRSFRISPEEGRHAILPAAIKPTRSRGAAMSNYTVMIPSATPGDALSSPPYGTLEDALRGAKFMLANGAESAWIVDGRGGLVLPAGQVRSRLDSVDTSNRSPVRTTDPDTPRFRFVWPSLRRGVSAN